MLDVDINPKNLDSFLFISMRVNWVEAQYALRFSQFEPEIMLDAMRNFKTHFMV